MRSARLGCTRAPLTAGPAPPSSQCVALALCIARRCQRSPPPRPPFASGDTANARSWKRRVAAHERLAEAQREALRGAHRRRDRLHAESAQDGKQGSLAWLDRLLPTRLRLKLQRLRDERRDAERHMDEQERKNHNKKKNGKDFDILEAVRESVDEERAEEAQGKAGSTSVRFFNKHVRSLREFFGLGTSQPVPMSPLMVAKEAAIGDNDPSLRSIDRFLLASQSLQWKPSSTEKELKEQIKLTPSEELRVMARYAQRQWYGVFYRPIRRLTTRQIRLRKNAMSVVVFVCVVVLFAVILILYTAEVRTVLLLSPEDQKDYIYMVMGMRYGDIARVGDARLAKEDPLEALPIAARYHVVIEACREQHWHTMDWATELRKMHPGSALEERDWRHLVYWLVMNVGNAMQLGGGLFTERAYFVHQAMDEARRREREESFVPAGPSEMPSAHD